MKLSKKIAILATALISFAFISCDTDTDDSKPPAAESVRKKVSFRLAQFAFVPVLQKAVHLLVPVLFRAAARPAFVRSGKSFFVLVNQPARKNLQNFHLEADFLPGRLRLLLRSEKRIV